MNRSDGAIRDVYTQRHVIPHIWNALMAYIAFLDETWAS